MQIRENELKTWIKKTIGQTIPFTLKPLAGDASFRRYFRLEYQGIKNIVMDAPPEKEALEPFISIAEALRKVSVSTPLIHAVNKEAGFMLLEDFGDTLFLQALNKNSADSLYKRAIDVLVKIQNCSTTDPLLPPFDKAHMLKEMRLFKEWFLDAYLSLKLERSEEKMIDETMENLANTLSLQPQVFIHRDYHSRNIMILEEERLGIIDFQDAMLGPISYDIVSLLKDCYLVWDREEVLKWLLYFYENNPRLSSYSFDEFVKAFDYCGLQRHLKVLGIFSRLYLRDHKPGYLKDLPLTLRYVLDCSESYSELQPFYTFLKDRVRLP